MLEESVVSGNRTKNYMVFLQNKDRRRIEIQNNLDDLLGYKQKRVNKAFKAVDYYFDNYQDQIDINDVDLIEKAEKYYHEKTVGLSQKMQRFKEDPETIKLEKFVEWAKSRGGMEAFNQLSGKTEDQLTKEEKLNKK